MEDSIHKGTDMRLAGFLLFCFVFLASPVLAQPFPGAFPYHSDGPFCWGFGYAANNSVITASYGLIQHRAACGSIGSALSLNSRSWHDPLPGGDNDSIPEPGEQLTLDLKLRNTSGNNLTDVYATLASSLGKIQITDANETYGDIAAGQDCWGHNHYALFANMSSPASATFTVHVTYNIGTTPYYQDLTFTQDFTRVDSNVSPSRAVAFDPLPNGDGDGIIESGECPKFDLYLQNIGGGAFARNTQVRILSTNVGQVNPGYFDYPDIQNVEQKQLYGQISFWNGIPTSFAGTVTADIEITYDGLAAPAVIHGFPLFDVQPDPWVMVDPLLWNFGVTGTTQNVRKTVTVRNIGSKSMLVTGLTPSAPDTTVATTPLPTPAVPWTIPAGGTATFDVLIDTHLLQGQNIERTVIVSSNGRLGRADSGEDRVVITGLVSDTPPSFQIPGAAAWGDQVDVCGNIIVWAENRTGNYDIFAYDLSLGREFTICSASGDQLNPRISNGVIAWEDCRNWQSNFFSVNSFPVRLS